MLVSPLNKQKRNFTNVITCISAVSFVEEFLPSMLDHASNSPALHLSDALPIMPVYGL